MSDEREIPHSRRSEILPATPVDERAAPPERTIQKRADDPEVQRLVDALIETVCAEGVEAFDERLVREAITACLKLIPDGRDTGELKLMSAAIKELRYAFRVFAQYAEPMKCTIFGSARTPEGHPDYDAAVEFGRLIAQMGWMVITGAGDGIMKAGHVGPGRDASFGVAIRLPFETTANAIIAGDEKLIHFRYFFTRKLMFLFHADAVVLFPGGFGTMDEAFETLTLVQTGKAAMMPIVMVEGVNRPGIRSYWQHFDSFVRDTLLARGMVGLEDLNLYYIAPTPEDAAERARREHHERPGPPPNTSRSSTATTTRPGMCAMSWSSGSGASCARRMSRASTGISGSWSSGARSTRAARCPARKPISICRGSS